MENIHGIDPEHKFIHITPDRSKPLGLRGFVYLPPQTGLDELSEDATFEQKRDRETTLQILNGQFGGKITRRCGDEIGRCFPRLYPDLWRPSAEEMHAIEDEFETATLVPISLEKMKTRIKAYGQMFGLHQQDDRLSDVGEPLTSKPSRSPNLRRKAAMPAPKRRGKLLPRSQMHKPVKGTNVAEPTNGQAPSAKMRQDRDWRASSVATRMPPSRSPSPRAIAPLRKRRLEELFADSEDDEANVPVKKQDHRDRRHEAFRLPTPNRGEVPGRKCSVADLVANEGEDDESVYRRLKLQADKQQSPKETTQKGTRVGHSDVGKGERGLDQWPAYNKTIGNPERNFTSEVFCKGSHGQRAGTLSRETTRTLSPNIRHTGFRPRAAAPKEDVIGKRNEAGLFVEYDSDGAHHYNELSPYYERPTTKPAAALATKHRNNGTGMVGKRLEDLRHETVQHKGSAHKEMGARKETNTRKDLDACRGKDTCQEKIGRKETDARQASSASKEADTHEKADACRTAYPAGSRTEKDDEKNDTEARTNFTSVTFTATNSRAIIAPTIMPIIYNFNSIMSAVERPNPPPAKPGLINGLPAAWFQPSAIRWAPSALEYLHGQSQCLERAADRAFAAEKARVRRERRGNRKGHGEGEFLSTKTIGRSAPRHRDRGAKAAVSKWKHDVAAAANERPAPVWGSQRDDVVGGSRDPPAGLFIVSEEEEEETEYSPSSTPAEESDEDYFD